MSNPYKIPSEVSFRQVGKEAFVLHRNDSKVYNLNSTATLIWLEIQKGTSLSVIVENVCDKFDISHNTANDDTMELIDQLTRDKLLVRTDSDDT
jgi:hypothetical protein